MQGMQAKVAGLWRTALGLPDHVPLRNTDSFFMCGGDSLAALRYAYVPKETYYKAKETY